MLPPAPFSQFVEDRGQKRYTRAEFVNAPTQVKNSRVSNHGPIVSVREGMGRRLCTVILKASDRSSRTLLRKAMAR